jgi:hypothetical protein
MKLRPTLESRPPLLRCSAALVSSLLLLLLFAALGFVIFDAGVFNAGRLGRFTDWHVLLRIVR